MKSIGFVSETPEGRPEERVEMMLTVIAGNVKLDIIIKPDQQIRRVCSLLAGNGCIPPVYEAKEIQVYSVRRKAYIDPELCFKQCGIYNGDILKIF